MEVITIIITMEVITMKVIIISLRFISSIVDSGLMTILGEYLFSTVAYEYLNLNVYKYPWNE